MRLCALCHCVQQQRLQIASRQQGTGSCDGSYSTLLFGWLLGTQEAPAHSALWQMADASCSSGAQPRLKNMKPATNKRCTKPTASLLTLLLLPRDCRSTRKYCPAQHSRAQRNTAVEIILRRSIQHPSPLPQPGTGCCWAAGVRGTCCSCCQCSTLVSTT